MGLVAASACALVGAVAGVLSGAETFEPPRRFDVPPSPARTPADEARTFTLADGFRAELFASEPMVQDPVAITFDEDGRLWVVEMRGFMPTVDGKGETEPVGRVSVLEDTDDDGRADRSTVFLDGIVLPRAVAKIRGGALVAHGGQVFLVHDRDGDGRADTKNGAIDQEVVDPEYAIKGNPEHQANGLLWGRDNWIYNANAVTRFRRVGGTWTKDRTEFRGQWGIDHDDWGRLYYDVNYDQLRADVVPPNAMNRNPHNPSTRGLNVAVAGANEQRVFPARLTTGVNRGYRRGILDERGRLVTFTAACQPLVYRADAYGPAFRGNVFVLEPAANLIKRNLVDDRGLEITARFAYPDREFMTSTDERFRPVDSALGPDGAIYVADMYRGILQHGRYISPYLRREILVRGLDKPINLGRIWRLVGPGMKRGAPPRLSRASGAELVATLSHGNGWWRDTAQRLLVERGEADVVPALLALARDGEADARARVAALWTLEGLDGSELSAVLPIVDDSEPHVAAAAMRVLEARAARGSDRTLGTRVVRVLDRIPSGGETPAVALQRALTLGALRRGNAGHRTLLAVARRHGGSPVVADAVIAGLEGRELTFLRDLLRDPATSAEASGLSPLLQGLASAVTRTGGERNVTALLDLAVAQTGTTVWRRKALLAGIAQNRARLEETPVKLRRAPPALARLSKADPALGPTLATLDSMLSWPGHERGLPPVVRKPPSPAREAFLTEGKELYATHCAPCHGGHGEGLETLAPPLVGSEWVTGPPERLVRIVLRGIEGAVRVRGETYTAPRVMESMPGVEGLLDEQISALLSWMRDELGRGSYDVTMKLVRETRDAVAAREHPFTETELLAVQAGPPPLPEETVQ